MKKYYKLSNGTTGKPLASYARNQPHIEGLVYLEENPFEFGIYDGSEWIEDSVEVARKQLNESDNDIEKRGIDNLIDIFLSKGIITEDDLPVELRDKYNNRKILRGQL